MATPLLWTKLHIPPTRPEWVRRPRLVEQLEAGLGRKLTLVSAPAGFGKTTLLSGWVREARPRVAWLSLDDRDNDPACFLAYLVSALQQILEGVGEEVLDALQRPQPPPVEELGTVLINRIDAALAGDPTRAPCVLILDDYHLIHAQAVHRVITFMLEHMPAQIHLVIATRADPPLPLTRLRGRGELNEVRQSDLAFTVDEAAAFLAQATGLELSPSQVAALDTRMEGWITGLQLAAIALRSRVAPFTSPPAREQVDRFVRSFTGSNRFILDYLLEEVLEQQPAEVQDFLLQTSILERISAPLCDAVLEGDEPTARREDRREGAAGGSSALLEHLERANLFVVPLDDERRWYRYHHLFAELLHKRLRQAWPERLPVLHRRASAWYERNGPIQAAIDHAIAAGDLERAAGMIEGTAEQAFRRGEYATVLRWLDALPDGLVRSRPLLCVYHAAALSVGTRPLEEVEARLRDAEEGGSAGVVPGVVAALRAALATLAGDGQRGVELSQRALELLPEGEHFFRGFVARNAGVAYKLTGDVRAGVRLLEEAVRAAQQQGDLVGAIVSLYQLAELRILQGRLYEAEALCQKGREMSAGGGDRLLPVVIKLLLGLGRLHYEWNDLEEAARLFSEALELSRQSGATWGLIGNLYLAMIGQAQGDIAGARRAIQLARQSAIEFDITDVDDIVVDAYQARLWVAQGDLEPAARWVEQRRLEQGIDLPDAQTGPGSGMISYHLREIEYSTLVRLYLAQGRPGEALAVLGPLLPVAEQLGRTGSVIEMLGLQALAFQVQGDRERALDSLGRALALARPGGYVRLFVDGGAEMERLLRQAAAHGVAPEYVRELLAAFAAEPGREIVSPASRQQPLIEPLSERELQVLRLLAAGLSNPEIAAELVIATSTVRSHLKSIYGKLNVHRRWDAAERARELGLL